MDRDIQFIGESGAFFLANADGNAAIRSTVVHRDGQLIPVEIVGHEVQLEKGRMIVQGIFRPLTTVDPSEP